MIAPEAVTLACVTLAACQAGDLAPSGAGEDAASAPVAQDEAADPAQRVDPAEPVGAGAPWLPSPVVVSVVEPPCTSDAACDDGRPCTTERCLAMGCVTAMVDAPCDDGSACTVGDACSRGLCMPGATLDCDDGDPCTTDACDDAGGCVSTAVATCCSPEQAAACDDGSPCTADGCDALAGCSHLPAAGPCEDGSACTDGDHCAFGSCVPGAPVACVESALCQTDTCVAAQGCLPPPPDPHDFPVEVGQKTQAFVPVADGQAIQIVHGPQGGIHLLAAFRATLPPVITWSPVKVSYTATTRLGCCATGPVVGSVTSGAAAAWKTPDTEAEYVYSPMQIVFDSKESADYAGQTCCVRVDVAVFPIDGQGPPLLQSYGRHVFTCQE